ncbi:MAG: type II toxin-antitoxin system HicB family antitoxin [Victivallales bacterium]|nr:type II toxin-antitoxin system HicB family antitoxin [Victivallales bacterium]
MEKRTYFLAVSQAPEGGYTCRFPDFECVVDQGETLEEAIANARELLYFTVSYMIDHKLHLPTPSEGKFLKEKLQEELFCLVPINVYPPAKTERINIAAPGDKIAEITDYAKRSKLSRSELMVNATLAYIRANA